MRLSPLRSPQADRNVVCPRCPLSLVLGRFLSDRVHHQHLNLTLRAI